MYSYSLCGWSLNLTQQSACKSVYLHTVLRSPKVQWNDSVLQEYTETTTTNTHTMYRCSVSAHVKLSLVLNILHFLKPCHTCHTLLASYCSDQLLASSMSAETFQCTSSSVMSTHRATHHQRSQQTEQSVGAISVGMNKHQRIDFTTFSPSIPQSQCTFAFPPWVSWPMCQTQQCYRSQHPEIIDKCSLYICVYSYMQSWNWHTW